MTRIQKKEPASEPTIIAEQHRKTEGPSSKSGKIKDLEKKYPVASEPTIISEQKRKPKNDS